MAPQQSIPLAANVLGTIGTVLWCIQSLPQIWHSYRTKSTEGLPAAMTFLWGTSGLPFGVYAICQNFNIPLQIQPQIFGFLFTVSWGQCMYYGRGWRAWKAVLAVAIIAIVFAALEVALVLTLRPLYWDNGVEWPITMIGVIAVVVLLSGYIPVPLELIKRRGRVVGIDFWFLLMDSSGALFSLLSLLVQDTFDTEFGTLYILCMAFEYAILISHGVWLLRTRGIRKRAKEAQTPYDDFPEAIEWQAQAWTLDWLSLKGIRRSKKDPEKDVSKLDEPIDAKV
ncbi:putative membrane protein [Pseudocercospora fuligena]|uniref:Putative membrane protein n=1 Tax=Pseudocercospora fuligena TaxID=685502 RepID=A0A8H6VF59_9PEZI|nr:putative membrane protein [Pseudocercospora fuligena]